MIDMGNHFHLIHGPFAGAKDLEVKVVVVDLPSFEGDGAGFVEDVATDGVVFGALGDIDAELFLDVNDRHLGIEDPSAGREGGEEGLLADVVFIGDFSDELFEDVFDSDDSFSASPFIDDDGEVDLFTAELLEKGGEFFCLGSVEDGFDEFADGGIENMRGVKLLDVHFEDVFVEENADDVVDGVVIDGNSAVAFREELLGGFVNGCVIGHAEDIDAGDHDLAGDSFFQGHDREDEFLFSGVEVGSKFCFLEELIDFVADFKCG